MAKVKIYTIRKNVPEEGDKPVPTPTLLAALSLHGIGDYTETKSGDDHKAARRVAYNLATRTGSKFKIRVLKNGRLGIWSVE